MVLMGWVLYEFTRGDRSRCRDRKSLVSTIERSRVCIELGDVEGRVCCPQSRWSRGDGIRLSEGVKSDKSSCIRKGFAYPLYEIPLKKDRSWLLLSWKGRGTDLDQPGFTVSFWQSLTQLIKNEELRFENEREKP
jgi:hypothetical protein